jgi:hypothetical protein
MLSKQASKTMWFKCIAFVTGAALIGAVTHQQVLANASQAYLFYAIGCGIIVGSLAVGRAWSASLCKTAVLLAITLSCGELYSLLTTAQKAIITANAVNTPLALENINYSNATQRLTSALTSKADADKAVLSEASKSGCKVSCARMLSEAVDAASREVTQARKALAGIKVPSGSSSPLAAFFGLSETTMSVLLASLFSLAGAGLGSALISYGGSTASVAVSPMDSVAQFLLATLQPSTGGSVTSTLLESRYIAWTISTNQRPLPYDTFKSCLTALLMTSGVTVTEGGIENVALR